MKFVDYVSQDRSFRLCYSLQTAARVTNIELQHVYLT